jgi:hypothetical protein
MSFLWNKIEKQRQTFDEEVYHYIHIARYYYCIKYTSMGKKSWEKCMRFFVYFVSTIFNFLIMFQIITSLCPKQIEINYDRKMQTKKNIWLHKLKLIVIVCWSKLLLDFDYLPSIITVVPFQVQHKLYYFHFCWIEKIKWWMLEI